MRYLVFGLCVVAAACGSQVPGAPTSPSSAISGTAATEAKGGPALPFKGTQEVSNGLGPDLAAVRAATAQFHDVDVAAAAGYRFGEPCVESPAGAMGSHTPNPALIDTQTLDPLTPETLFVPLQAWRGPAADRRRICADRVAAQHRDQRGRPVVLCHALAVDLSGRDAHAAAVRPDVPGADAWT